MAKDFSKLTEEQIAALTGKDLAAYQAYLLKKNAPTPDPDDDDEEDEDEDEAPAKGKAKKVLTPHETGRAYLKQNPKCGFDAVHVTDDLVVFPGTQQGKNHAINYAKANGQDPDKVTEVNR